MLCEKRAVFSKVLIWSNLVRLIKGPCPPQRARSCHAAVTMATTGLRIGDQLVLEEDYDENYIPSEQGY